MQRIRSPLTSKGGSMLEAICTVKCASSGASRVASGSPSWSSSLFSKLKQHLQSFESCTNKQEVEDTKASIKELKKPEAMTVNIVDVGSEFAAELP
eukprot:5470301-Amphidinium_carterae.1